MKAIVFLSSFFFFYLLLSYSLWAILEEFGLFFFCFLLFTWPLKYFYSLFMYAYKHIQQCVLLWGTRHLVPSSSQFIEKSYKLFLSIYFVASSSVLFFYDELFCGILIYYLLSGHFIDERV